MKIIAKRTDERWGYRKGDVLEIERRLADGGVAAKNLTVPDNYGRQFAYLLRHEYSYATEVPQLTAEYRIFGIPILRRYEYER